MYFQSSLCTLLNYMMNVVHLWRNGPFLVRNWPIFLQKLTKWLIFFMHNKLFNEIYTLLTFGFNFLVWKISVGKEERDLLVCCCFFKNQNVHSWKKCNSSSFLFSNTILSFSMMIVCSHFGFLKEHSIQYNIGNNIALKKLKSKINSHKTKKITSHG